MSAPITRLFSGSARNALVRAKKYVFAKQFEGLPKTTDLQLVEEELRSIRDGEFLAEALYLSVDPYMRAYASTLKTGTTFFGSQVAKVTESKYPKYPVGSYIVGKFGWRTHTIADDSPDPAGLANHWLIPDPEGLPLSLFLGILGMPGNTAYFGFLEICQPKPGETVVVSGAAGAVGSTVGQIAKIKGCKVIGIAGSEEKGKWLTNELNFDHFINYKDPNFQKKLIQAAPKGIDCYFDNVGGEISTTVLKNMNDFGRTAICGAISSYNDEEKAETEYLQRTLFTKQLKMEGFRSIRWINRWPEGTLQLKKWIKEGKLNYRETVTDGFENTTQAFIDMLKGKNFGKAVVKV